MFVCPVHVLSTCKYIYCNHNKNKSTFFALFTNNLSARTYIYAIGNCVSTISTSRDVLVQKSLSKKSHCMHLFQLTAFFSIFSLVLIVSTCGGIFTQLRAKPHTSIWAYYRYMSFWERMCCRQYFCQSNDNNNHPIFPPNKFYIEISGEHVQCLYRILKFVWHNKNFLSQNIYLHTYKYVYTHV